MNIDDFNNITTQRELANGASKTRITSLNTYSNRILITAGSC